MSGGGGGAGTNGDKANGRPAAEPKRINVLATGSVDQSIKVSPSLSLSLSCPVLYNGKVTVSG